MNEFLARQLRELTAAVEATGGRLIAVVALALLTTVALIAGLGFFTVALFVKILALAGAFYAALAAGGASFVVALIALIALQLRRPTPPPPPPKPTPVAQEKAEQRAILAANIDETVAPILSALHEANMQPEELALRVGAELSKQTGGFGLVALALAAGFVAARQIRTNKR